MRSLPCSAIGAPSLSASRTSTARARAPRPHDVSLSGRYKTMAACCAPGLCGRACTSALRGDRFGRSARRAEQATGQCQEGGGEHRAQLRIIEERGTVERRLGFHVAARYQVTIRDPFRLDTAERRTQSVTTARSMPKANPQRKRRADGRPARTDGPQREQHLASASSLVSISSRVTFLYGMTEKLATTDPLDDASSNRPETCTRNRCGDLQPHNQRQWFIASHAALHTHHIA